MKFSGKIGFAETVETKPGVWQEVITERQYFGDFLDIGRNLQTSGEVNDNVYITNKISIISDPYASNNFSSIRYAEFMGSKWKIINASISYPRLILTCGGVWNG